LAMVMTSLAVATVPSPLLLDDRQSVGRRTAPSVPVGLTLRYFGELPRPVPRVTCIESTAHLIEYA